MTRQHEDTTPADAPSDRTPGTLRKTRIIGGLHLKRSGARAGTGDTL